MTFILIVILGNAHSYHGTKVSLRILQSINSYCSFIFFSYFFLSNLVLSIIMAAKTETTKTAFSLHPSDNPGANLVSFPLNGENYTVWNRAMIKALSAKNKAGFIYGTIAKPPTSDSNHALWKQGDDMIASCIVNAFTPELAGDAIYARDLWVDLEERFSLVNGPRIFELQQKIFSIPQGQDSITLHYYRRG